MKVGICGLGLRMAYLVKVFAEYTQALNVVAYADPSPVGLPYLRENRIAPGTAYDSLSRMLECESLDLLMIGSPNHLHLDHIRAGVRHGVSIFCEKPVVTTEDQTYELLRELQRHRSTEVMVGLVLRYSPLYRDLVRVIDDGVLGSISSIEACEHIAPGHGAFFMRDWRRRSEYSGGFLLEKCCHDLDLYQGAARERPARVVSFGGRRTFVPSNGYLECERVYHRMTTGWSGAGSVFTGDGDIVDHQTALIEYENGVNLCFHTNMNVPDPFRHFCIVGTKATAEGDFERNYFRVRDARDSRLLYDCSYEFADPLGHYGAEELMVADVCAHLSSGTDLPVSVLDALEAGLTAIKLDESRRRGEILDMEPVWRRFDSFGLRDSQSTDQTDG